MSTLSDALVAMDKAIWKNGDSFSSVEEKEKALETVQDAAPDAIAWIKEAVEYLIEFRPDVATEVKMWKGRSREKYLAENLKKLDALIAEAKGGEK